MSKQSKWIDTHFSANTWHEVKKILGYYTSDLVKSTMSAQFMSKLPCRSLKIWTQVRLWYVIRLKYYITEEILQEIH